MTSYTSHIVQKFDNNLNDLGTFASGFTYAGNSAFDADGNMWIANSYASQVLKLDSSGAVILTIASPLVFPRSVVVLPNGNIAVSDASYITYIFDADTGLLLSQFAMPGSNPSYPWSSSIAKYVMPDGDMILFYYESGVYQINKFKVDGTIVSF